MEIFLATKLGRSTLFTGKVFISTPEDTGPALITLAEADGHKLDKLGLLSRLSANIGQTSCFTSVLTSPRDG